MEENHEPPLPPHSESFINVINAIKFTSREIDILAFILGGRTAKKIASFLSLSPKRVENCISQIMLKLQCNSRMSIIDFLESSDKTPFLKRHYSMLVGKPSLEQPLSLPDEKPKLSEAIKTLDFLQKRKWKYTILAFFALICGLGFTTYKYHDNKMQKDTIRSDLVIPTESVFLNRLELMAQIEDRFKGQSGIQTIALVGPGGSGKTTLARQYVHPQKANVLWEINAETHESLKGAFENLAEALAKTKEGKKIFRELQEIKDTLARENKIIQFVKEHLKIYSNWLLIFDITPAIKQ